MDPIHSQDNLSALPPPSEKERSTNFTCGSGSLKGTSILTSLSLSSEAYLSQRIVNIEYYMCPPVKDFDNVYSDFRSSAVKRVPVIRIFGATPAGQKICANIHGVYPYITVLDDENVEGLDYRIASALDTAINESISVDTNNKFPNSSKGNYSQPSQHVFKVIRVLGKTFYGFRSNSEVFLRIYFYNPLIIKKAVDLLQSGSILGRRFQPYEAHIPYNLQFMIDYGLYGMNFVHYTSVKFRKNDVTLQKEQHQCLNDLLSQTSNTSASSGFNAAYINPETIEEHLLSPAPLVKQTLCELEIDVIASDIVIETGRSSKRSVNPGIDSIWKDEIERRRQEGVEDCSQISIPSSQARPKVEMHKMEDKFQQVLWSKVESFFNDGEMEIQTSENVSQSQSFLEDAHLLPSSQVPDHFSKGNEEDIENEGGSQMSPEEDEFIKLLEEMAKDIDSEHYVEQNEPNSLSDDLVDESHDFEEGIDEVDDDWDDTLLSQSILQKISEAEACYEEAKAIDEQKSERELLQCDGQGDDSDSSISSEIFDKKKLKKVSSPSRSSKRISEVNKRKSGIAQVSSEATKSGSANTEKEEASVSETHKSKRVHRLSRSLSRSRVGSISSDLKKSESVETIPIPVEPVTMVEEAKSSTKLETAQPRSSSVTTRRTRNSEAVTPTKKSGLSESQLEEIMRSPVPFVKLEKIDSQKEYKKLTTKRERKINLRFLDEGEFELPLQLSQSSTKSDGQNSTGSGTRRRGRPSEKGAEHKNGSREKESEKVGKIEAKIETESKKIEPVEHARKTKTSSEAKKPKAKEKETVAEPRSRLRRRLSLSRFPSSGNTVSKKNSETKAIRNFVQTTFDPERFAESRKSSSGEGEKLNSSPTAQDNTKLTRSRSFLERLKNESVKGPSVKNEDDPNHKTPSTSTTVKVNANKRRLGLRITRKEMCKSHSSSESLSCSPKSEPASVSPSHAIAAVVKANDVELGHGHQSSSEPIPIPPSPKTLDQGSNTETNTFVDVGTECKPSMISKMDQTEVILNDQSVQVEPLTCSKITQVPKKVFVNATTQTEAGRTSNEVQTEMVAPLCLCQCTCVVKLKEDVGIDVQEDLKPEMRNQRIQVDNVDMITSARSSRFTTPQSRGPRASSKTPSRSPEKRRVSRDSPVRKPRMFITPGSSSRYLNALGMKTPQSSGVGSRSRNSGASSRSHSQSSPEGDRGERGQVLTPPSRESKEVYLAKVIGSTSPHHHHHHHPRRRYSIKPRNLEAEASHLPDEGAPNESNWAPNSTVTSIDLNSLQFNQVSHEPIEIPSQSDEALGGEIMEQPFPPGYVDLNINSVYEYEDDNDAEVITLDGEQSQDETPKEQIEQILGHVRNPLDLPLPPVVVEVERPTTPPSSVPSSEAETPPISGSPSVSIFQQKRIISRQRTKFRIEKRKAANVQANLGIPDVFPLEVEPLKQPPSYKSLAKWLGSVRSTPGGLKKLKSLNLNQVDDDDDEEEQVVDKWFSKDSSSDEEELPKVRLFGGGGVSLSDDESDSDSSSDDGIILEEDAIKTFTPLLNDNLNSFSFMASQTSQGSQGTPSSILRSARGTPTSVRRLSGVSLLKRKIRWEDEPMEYDKLSLNASKRLKFDDNSMTESQGSKTIDTSELDGPSFKNALGLDNSMSNLQDCKALHTFQFLTTMCIELHCVSRNGMNPDPKEDPILAIFILITNDYPEGFGKPKECLNVLIFGDEVTEFDLFERNQKFKVFTDEGQMIEEFIDLVRYWDPDIFMGYEVEKSSFGYLMQRGLHLGKDMTQELSRVLPPPQQKNGGVSSWRLKQEWNGMISGRIVLNLWRLLRHEISVQSYTFENAAYHILRRRVYKFSWKTLSSFWNERIMRRKVIQYYTIRVKGVVQIMEKLDLINRTSELARLFGIQFYEVLSRGSQFRVESMMLRATKPLDFIAPSPGVMQRARMRAPEYLPLILEPKSNFYTDPVAVLDFQSLYPSMMIAYNYDYASVLGRVEHLGTQDAFAFGCLEHQVSPGDLLRLKDHIHVSPAGVAFVDSSIVRGILPEMLEQILETRQMVKRSMKRWKNEGASLQKVLDSRQLGLKLIANVTYGYTSANFSGRMPCVEIADSILSKGRETLQRAIDYVKDNFDRWGAEVIYGDTDSLFILFKGRSREDAFKMAYEIAEEVTQQNPKPVKLKFEKIYQPCVLQSKKRYVGFAYESPEQVKPNYDAKGIETVRRDGCPAVRKILERTLHILFERGKGKVEEYVKIQFEKLFKGRVSMQDYIFAKEFRGRAGYKPGASVPSLEIAKRLTANDPRAEPLVSERVPYVVIYGNPSLPLIKLVRTPEEFMEDSSMRLNAHYYIEKVIIPALNRCLTLAGLDATKWFIQLPRKYLRNVLDQKKGKMGQLTLDDYVLHQNCMRCEGRTEGQRGLCHKCVGDDSASILYLTDILNGSIGKLNACKEICQSCSGENGKCVSVDCPVLHKLVRYERDQPYMQKVGKELAALEW